MLLTTLTQSAGQTLAPSLRRVFSRFFQGLAERRVAALRLAIRLYQVDHNGRVPATLNELAPKYIAAIPSDPFASDGRPLGYIASPTPLIYSVSMNGTDEHGDVTMLHSAKKRRDLPGSPDDAFTWDRPDAIFPIGAQTYAPPLTDPSGAN